MHTIFGDETDESTHAAPGRAGMWLTFLLAGEMMIAEILITFVRMVGMAPHQSLAVNEQKRESKMRSGARTLCGRNESLFRPLRSFLHHRRRSSSRPIITTPLVERFGTSRLLE